MRLIFLTWNFWWKWEVKRCSNSTHMGWYPCEHISLTLLMRHVHAIGYGNEVRNWKRMGRNSEMNGASEELVTNQLYNNTLIVLWGRGLGHQFEKKSVLKPKGQERKTLMKFKSTTLRNNFVVQVRDSMGGLETWKTSPGTNHCLTTVPLLMKSDLVNFF